MNFFPFHIGDYAAHTRNLSLMEDLAYRRLLDAYYLAEMAFNGSAADVARSIGMREHIEAVEYVLGHFFVKTESGWLNTRADKEIERFKMKSEQASRAGKASVERRLNARSTSVEHPLNRHSTPVDQSATDVQPTKNQEPITNNQYLQKEVKEKASAPRAVAPDIPEIPRELLADFLKIRQAKKSPLTETAIAGIRREAKKAGIPIAEAVRVCCEYGWQGFRADWYAERSKATAGYGQINKQEALEARNREVAERFIKKMGLDNASA